jgi:hypothetical protein
VGRLLAGNGGCRFPCLWGIAPGETTSDAAYALVASLSVYVSPPIDGQSGNFGAIIADLPDGIEGTLTFKAQVEDGVVVRMHMYGIQGVSALRLSDLMSEYGAPSEVWAHSWNEFFRPTPPLGLFLLYSDQGILAQYSEEAEQRGDSNWACFDSNASLRLWLPSGHVTFPEVKALFDLTYDGIDLPSEEALGMDPQEFFERYRAENAPCISTLRCHWPNISGSPGTPCP